MPVFRYALERWAADPYQLVVFHQGPIERATDQALTVLEKAANDGTINLVTTRIDVARPIPAEFRSLWQASNPDKPSLAILQYPTAANLAQPAWRGPVTERNILSLRDSPVRTNLTVLLSAGAKSAVWLLVESGDRERDEAAARLIETESATLARKLKLPEAVTGEKPALTARPLTISFGTLHIRRDDPAERVLLDMLLNTCPGTPPDGPIVFPVLGRGRALPALFGKGLSAQAIGDAAEFITGACSCEAKLSNPGFDLMLAGNWDALIGERLVTVPERPPLTGLSQLSASAMAPPPEPAPPLPPAQFLDVSAGVLWKVLGAFAVCILVVAATTLVFRRKASAD